MALIKDDFPDPISPATPSSLPHSTKRLTLCKAWIDLDAAITPLESLLTELGSPLGVTSQKQLTLVSYKDKRTHSFLREVIAER